MAKKSVAKVHRIPQYASMIGVGNFRDENIVKCESNAARLRCYPKERQIGKTGIVIAAANVTVNVGKPYLLDNLICRPFGLPYGRDKGFPAFVDRQGLIRIFDMAAESYVMELVSFSHEMIEDADWNSERSDRVPDANKGDFRLPAIIVSKLAGYGKIGWGIKTTI